MRTLRPLSLLTLLMAIPAFAQQPDIVWLTDRFEYHGSGCSPREAASTGQPVIYVVTAGNEFSVIYTDLGTRFHESRRNPGTQRSACRFVMPAKVKPKSFVSQVTQTTLLFGLVKTAGVEIKIEADTNFVRRLPNGGYPEGQLKKTMSKAKVIYPADQAIDEPLNALQTVMRTKFQRRNDEADDSFNRFCKRASPTGEMDYLSDVVIKVTNTSPGASFAIGVDGQDVSYTTALAFDACDPRNP